MMAALGTLAFLTTLWLIVVVGAAVLEESGAKIGAALKGRTVSDSLPTPALQRPRTRLKIAQPRRATVHLRAAA